MPVPDRRTILVLGSLVAGMTVASALLLVLEPGPLTPLSGVTLQSIERETRPEARLFDTPAPLDWRAIVIHDAGFAHGSSQTLNEMHQQLGKGGLGYHFVINNGTGELDGLIEVGFRWQRQMLGAYLDGPRADWFHKHAIGICLVGDGDQGQFTRAQVRELVWLVQQLQRQYGIPRQAVLTQIGSDPDSPSPRFPYAEFESQLLTP